MRMRILTEARQIRSAVRDVLDSAAGDRVVAVAFVGGDALSFCAAPRGVSVYCWPQPGGTNPAAIDQLLRAGAQVHFVHGLHAKVYWSRRRGTLIGSANLTANALGEAGLREVMVWLPPGAFEIQPFIKSLKVVRDFDGTLRWLHQAHVHFLQRNPPRRPAREAPLQIPSFRTWLSDGRRRAEWRLGWYDQGADAPRDALDAFESETGTRRFATFLGLERASDLKAGVFTLSFQVREMSTGRIKVTAMEWWAPEVSVRSHNKGWKDYPHLWFARRRIPHGARPPFDAGERRFRRALAEVIEECGGLAWLGRTSTKPSRSFLERLRRRYDASSG